MGGKTTFKLFFYTVQYFGSTLEITVHVTGIIAMRPLTPAICSVVELPGHSNIWIIHG